MAFPARFNNKCVNGHPVKIGDVIAFNDEGVMLCMKCDAFHERRISKEVLYSNKICPRCNYELPLTGVCDNH